MPKMYCNCSLWDLFTYIYQQLSSVRLQKFVSITVCIFPLQSLQCPLFQTTKFCSVRFFRLQNFVVCAFQTTKVCSVQCPLFQTKKVCSVRSFRLQNFVVFTFLDYKSLQCAFFQTTNVCSVRFFRLQMFLLLSCNVLDSVQVHGDIVQCFKGVKAKQPSILIPSKELQSRLTRGKGQSVG